MNKFEREVVLVIVVIDAVLPLKLPIVAVLACKVSVSIFEADMFAVVIWSTSMFVRLYKAK